MNKKTIGSWVQSANTDTCDFPIENLPYGCFHELRDASSQKKIGIAIGDCILPLTNLSQHMAIPEPLKEGFCLLDQQQMNSFMALPASFQEKMRRFLMSLLAQNSSHKEKLSPLLIQQAEVKMHLPCQIPDFTDFYAGIYHATNVGQMLRPDQPLAPNYQWIPVAYHGRSSSIIPSGENIKRPIGQTRAGEGKPPYFQASRRLDYELELGVFIGQPNRQGHPIEMQDAEEHFFGMCLLNDWSARDIQGWEAVPLGPFLAKNFATSISPWIVTRQALDPFRKPWQRNEIDPQPLAYLESESNRASGAIEIQLEVYLLTSQMKEKNLPAQHIVSSEFSKAAYWSIAQLITHHTSNGCNLNAGDLLGTGTLSGSTAQEAGSLLELSRGGKEPIELSNGEKRSFLEDGDTVIFKAYCETEGQVRIGFGECQTLIVS
jgi:fumarylacetoacetase